MPENLRDTIKRDEAILLIPTHRQKRNSVPILTGPFPGGYYRKALRSLRTSQRKLRPGSSRPHHKPARVSSCRVMYLN